MASFQKYDTKEGVRWLYKYYGAIDPRTGKAKPSTKRGFKTKKEAQLHAAQTEIEIQEGSFITDKNSTFEAIYNLWYATNELSWKPSTRKAVKSKFKQQLLPHFGKLKMKDITKVYCQEVINKMAAKIKTVDNMKMYANQIFEFAIENDVIKTNPLKKVKIPKPEEEHYAPDEEGRNFWEKHEVQKFLAIVAAECSFRDYVMFHTLIYRGPRKGEMLALGELDIGFSQKQVTLNKTLYWEDGKYYVLTSKTPASRRVLPADKKTLQLWKRLLTMQKQQQLAEGRSGPIKFLFTREDGVTPLRLAYLNDLLEALIIKHNLHSVTVHGLRHTHASLQFEAGATIKEVQYILGHSDINMTMNVYTHVTRGVKERGSNRFEEFMENDDPITGSNVVTLGDWANEKED
ncbi:site-specific integrase [Paenibacillus sonchi]|uniref:site-specific integrase n=1 Tax=Paenibacillus sonchi TaxID=373687 RepID=UPI001E2F3ED2|nr:site-specific integrase [Paenibacillus sonchi]